MLESERAEEIKDVISGNLSAEISENEMLSILSDSLGEGYSITLNDSEKIEFTENSVSRAATDFGYESKLCLCDIVNNDTGVSGFALTSNDRRLGPVLAILPDAEFGDNELSAMLMDKVADYIEYTDSVMQALDKSEFGRSIAPESQAATNDYKFKNFRCNRKNESNMLYTNWTQGYPYNAIVNSEINDGKSYPVGCGPIALGQIFTRVRPLSKCSLGKYSNVAYDWDKMSEINSTSYGKNVSTIYGTSNETKTMIQALLREIGLGCNATYSTSGTGITIDNAKKYLDRINLSYKCSNYSFGTVKSAIDNGSLLYVAAKSHCTETRYRRYFKIFGKKTRNSNWSEYSYFNGHAFVIDAYANYNYDLYNSSNNYVQTCSSDFVHVNVGWANLNKSGYYLSGLFNTNNTPLSDASNSSRAGWHTDKTGETTYGENYYYRYGVKVLYNFGK